MTKACRLALLLPLFAIGLGQQTVAQQTTGSAVLPEQPPFELVVRPVNIRGPQGPADTDTPFQIKPKANLPLRLELTWSGDEPVTIFWGNLSFGDWVRLTIKTPLERELVTSHNTPELRPDRARGSQIITLQPGESATGSLQVGAGAAGTQMFRFLEPGSYELTASVDVHVSSGDPAQPESWQSLGPVTAPPVPFEVGFGDDSDVDYRLVRGLVTDADGEPVPHADVYIHVERTSLSSPLMSKRFTPFDRAVTNEEGRFVFPSIPAGEPRLMLAVFHQSLPPADRTVAPDPALDALDVDFQLSPGRTVNGTVVDTEGRPLPGVALGRPWVPWMRFPDAVITGPDGRFEIHGVPTEGATRIPARRRDLEIADDSNLVSAGRETTTATIIMQPRQAPGKLTGIARFENGEPARNMDLTLWIELADRNTRELRGTADRDGRFSIELTSDLADETGPMTGVAELGGTPENEVRDRWMTRFDLPRSDREFELEFRREHTLTVNLSSVVPLPSDLNVRMTVAARPSYGSRMIFSRTYRGSHLSPSTLPELSPGRYRVDVQLQEASHYNWSEDLEIPFDGPRANHEVSIEIPEIHFGMLHVEVRYPDGRKPADRTTVWMNANNAHGWKHIYDGVATFPVVPVGPVTVQYNARDGIVGLPIRGRIEAESEITLGPLILQSVEEAYGHISGRVQMSDGTPALGAAASLQPYVSSSIVGFGDNLVSGSGGFDVSSLPGSTFLVVNLKGCDLWPPGSVVEQAASSFSFGQPADAFESQARTRSIVRPVTLVGGQEQVVDIDLPDVAFRDVTLKLPAGQAANATLWTDLGDSWMHMERGAWQDDHCTFSNVPDRPTRLILMRWDTAEGEHFQHRGSAVVPVPAGDAPVVEYDLSRTGTLRIRSAVRAEERQQLSYRVRVVDDDLPARLATVAGVGEVNDRFVDEEDFVTFQLAPGSYVVTATLDGDEQEQEVDIELGSDELVEFNFTASAGVSRCGVRIGGSARAIEQPAGAADDVNHMTSSRFRHWQPVLPWRKRFLAVPDNNPSVLALRSRLEDRSERLIHLLSIATEHEDCGFRRADPAGTNRADLPLTERVKHHVGQCVGVGFFVNFVGQVDTVEKQCQALSRPEFDGGFLATLFPGEF